MQADNTPDQQSVKPMDKFKGKGLLKMLASPRSRVNSSSQPFASTPAKDIADAEPALRDSEAKTTPSNSKIWGKLWGSRRSSESPRCSPGSPKVLGTTGIADDTLPLRVTPIRTAAADGSRDDVSDVADNDSHYSTPMLGGAASPGASPLAAGMDQTLVLTPSVLSYDDGATPLGQKQGMSDVLTPGFLASLGEMPGSPTSEYEDADADMMTVALVPADKLASLPGAYHMPQDALLMQPQQAPEPASPAAAAAPGGTAAAAEAPAVAIPASALSAMEGGEELVSSTPTGSAMARASSGPAVDVGDVALAVEVAGSPLASPAPASAPMSTPAAAQAAGMASSSSSRAATPAEPAAAGAVASRGPSPAAPAAAEGEDGATPMDMDEPTAAVAAAPSISSSSPRPMSPADAMASSRSHSSPAPPRSPVAEAGAAASGRSTPLQAPSPTQAAATAVAAGHVNRSAAASPHSSLVSPEGGAASHSLDDISSSGTPSPAIEPSFPPLGDDAATGAVQDGQPAALQEVEQAGQQALTSPGAAAGQSALVHHPTSSPGSPAAATAAVEEGTEKVPSPVTVQAATPAASADTASAAEPAETAADEQEAAGDAVSVPVPEGMEQATAGQLEGSVQGSAEPDGAAAAAADDIAEVAMPAASVAPAEVLQGGDDSTAAAPAEEEVDAAALQAGVQASAKMTPAERATSPAAAAAGCEDSEDNLVQPDEMLPEVLSCTSSSLVMQASGPAGEASAEGGISEGHPATPEDSLMDADDDLLSCPTPSEEPVLPPAGVAPHLARRASPAAAKFTPVRESLPLFATSAMRDSQMVSSDLLDEDERLLEEGRTAEPGEVEGGEAGAAAAGGNGGSRGGIGAAWGRMGRSLGGGAQRVTSAAGHLHSGAFVSRLAPVEEAGASEADTTSPQRAAAARMSPVQEEAGSTPLQPRVLEEGLQEGRSPGELSLGGSPLAPATAAAGTPAAAAGGNLATPSTADSFSLRPPRGSSPQAGGASFTPTMALHTGLAAGGDTTQALMAGIDTPAALGGALTPSLLDAASASPSLVYGAGRFLATPLRHQLEALPMDVARHAPLLDSSPLSLGGEDTTLSLEAQRALYHLEGGGEPSPKVSPKGSGMGTAANDVYQQILIKKLTEAEEALKHLQFDNEKLQEQLCTLEFQKDEMSNQDEFEREAREFAETQLAAAQAELAAMRAGRAADQAEIGRLQEVVAKVQGEAAAALQAKDGEQTAVQEQLLQARADFAAASDRLQENEVKLMNAQADAKAVGAQLEAAQKEHVQLMACVEQREKDVADLLREQQQQKVQLEKVMEQLIAAQTAKEHAVRKATETTHKANRLEAALQQALAGQDAAKGELAALQQKYALQARTLEEARAQVAAQQAEIAEVMGMCDTLLSEREKLKQGK